MIDLIPRKALIPELIPPSERYFSGEKLRAFGVEILGSEFTHNNLACALGISRKMLAYLLDGGHSPTLENYLRMTAEVDRPITAFLDSIGRPAWRK